ncbi:MAG: leucine-rich repeat domain-containing protein [Eubacterium sp.]|nr:leucine-rich repeat domain-containing protein [Eubacterium sp.]
MRTAAYHVHDYSSTLETAPTCTEKGVMKYTCECGDSYTQEITELGHNYLLVPGSSVDVTCTTNGKESDKKCSRCEKIITGQVIQAVGHSEVVDIAVSPTCSKTGLTEGSHCSVCGEIIVKQEVISKIDHIWNDGVTVKDPTCTLTGLKKFTCTKCGEEKSEVIKAKGHTIIVDDAIEATCTSEGKTEGSHCSECGNIIVEQDIIPKLEHSWANGETIKEATCTENGYYQYTCSSCNKKKTTIIGAKGHNEEEVAAVAATCTKAGKTSYKKCSVCGDILEEGNVIPALGHDYSIVSNTAVKESCTTDGKEADQKCSRCNSVLTGKKISSKGHNLTVHFAKKASCTKAGNRKYYSCDKCNKYFSDSDGDVEVEENSWVISAWGHNYGELIDEVPASCTVDGVKAHYECSECRKKFINENDTFIEKQDTDLKIKALGHKWDDGTITKEPTETDYGIKSYKCLLCGETKIEQIPATGKKEIPKDETTEKKTTEQPDPTKDTGIVPGVGSISADGKILTDTDGATYLVANRVTADKLKKNVAIADKKTSGKYRITKLVKKNGKVTGGTVQYMAPYNKNCKLISATNKIKLAGVTFTVTSIAPNCAKGCEKLNKVVIGKEVTQIGANAFKDCKSLKSIIIQSPSLKKIGSNAFKGINSKAKFKVPKKKLNQYTKLIKKAGAPKKAKITK